MSELLINQHGELEEAPVSTGSIRDESGRFVPGVSGNPHGRPKGINLSLTSLVKQSLENVPPGEQKTKAIQLVEKMLDQAIMEGDRATQKLIWNYIDGLPKGSLDITSNGEKLPQLPPEFEKLSLEFSHKAKAILVEPKKQLPKLDEAK